MAYRATPHRMMTVEKPNRAHVWLSDSYETVESATKSPRENPQGGKADSQGAEPSRRHMWMQSEVLRKGRYGENIMLAQKKTTTKPPWDADP